VINGVGDKTMNIDSKTDLGSAILIVEFEGGYAPVAIASTLGEARELAQDDLSRRGRAMNKGADCACPITYKLWSRGYDGSYELALEIPV
jgi:hypothetical protein